MRHQIKQLKASPLWQLRVLRIIVWATALWLGAVHAWAKRHYLENADALSYLDMADYLRHGAWTHALNAYWSPLYPMLIALVWRLVQPAAYWEFALLHVLGWLLFLVALGCFEFLLRELVHTQESLAPAAAAEQPLRPGFSTLGLLVLGYTLFLWASLFLIRIPLESPDMLVAACVYVLAGLLLRLRRGRHGWRVFLALGVVCGIGYWIKAPLFVFSLLIIPLALVFAGWRSWPRALGALVVFLVLCSPWIMAISQRVGRLTFGESGRLNYMWVINEVPQIHGQDGGDVRGAFLHPTRRIYAQPAAYEFATPVGGTYPVWYDPSYWFAGVSGHFSLRGHLAALSGNIARLYWFIFFDVLCGLLAGTLILWLLRQPRAWPKDLWPYAPLFVPACLGVALFMQLYLEGRYIAPFLVLFWLGGWAALRLPVGELTQRLARSATVVLAGLLLCSILISSAGESVATLRALWQGEVPAEHEEWQVAQYLHQRGVQPGDRVAVFGGSQRSFWARLSRTRIVAEIPEREITAFLEADHATQEAALAALGATGAKVVLTLSVSADRRLPGWQQVGQTPYFAYWFKPTPR